MPPPPPLPPPFPKTQPVKGLNSTEQCHHQPKHSTWRWTVMSSLFAPGPLCPRIDLPANRYAYGPMCPWTDVPTDLCAHGPMCPRINVVVAFSRLPEFIGKGWTIHFPHALFFLFFFLKRRFSSHSLMPLFRPGSVYSGSAS